VPESLANAAASIRRTFAPHIPLYLSSLLLNAIIVAMLSDYGIAPHFEAAKSFLTFFGVFVFLWIAFIVLGEFAAIVRDGFPPDPLTRMAGRLVRRFLAEDRVGNIVHAIVALGPLLIAFTVFKSAITLIHPFGWDATLSAWDKSIGFGHRPWLLLQPIIGHPPVTTALSWAYYIWFPAFFWCLASQAFSKHASALRMQFLLAFGFGFAIAGSILAVIFSSAGPCYYAHLNLGSDPYAAQMAYLRSIGPNALPSVIVQDALWKAFAGGKLAQGVSAMPSIHVTIAALLGFLGWRKGGFSAIFFPAFAVVIAVASVHLAWHYACDALAGIGLAAFFWHCAGQIVTSWNGYLSRAARDALPLGVTASGPLQ
jgi:hypothetical protein